jgi:hypothetical protein
MNTLTIEVPNSLEDIAAFLALVASGTERVYIAAAGHTTVGAIEIMGAALVEES